MAPPKAYCELGALTNTVKKLRSAGRLILVNFPYDARRSKKFGMAEPSLVTADSTYITCDSSIRISDTVGSPLLSKIREIVGSENESDVRHLDSAYRSDCDFFITPDKDDIIDKRDQLEPLLKLRILHHIDNKEELLKLFDDDVGG